MRSRADLEAMIEEATVDAYNEDEQAGGFLSMIQDHLELPFKTEVLGQAVQVVEVAQDDRGGLFAICERGKARQTIRLQDLPLPRQGPSGIEWIEAYRLWARGA